MLWRRNAGGMCSVEGWRLEWEVSVEVEGVFVWEDEVRAVQGEWNAWGNSLNLYFGLSV